MIKILCEPYNLHMSMTGHAGSGPEGHDLVCAAASMLMYTLAATVEVLERAGKVEDVVIDMQPGRSVVSCRAVPWLRKSVGILFAMAGIGASMLAKNYPEYVQYETPEDETPEDDDLMECWIFM